MTAPVKKPLKAVLFDIDGTLIDSNGCHVQAWAEAFRRLGAHVDDRAIHDQIGKGADMLIPALWPGATDAQRKRLEAAHGQVFQGEFLDRAQPFPGASSLLRRVHQAGRKVVLASSAPKTELERYMDVLGVRDLVSRTTTADDVENTKPAPDILSVALKTLAPLTAEEVIMVGDTPYDAMAADRCGVATIGLRSGGFSDAALTEAGAVAIFDDVASLLSAYERSPLAR